MTKKTVMTTITIRDNSWLFQLDNFVSKYAQIMNVYSVLCTLSFRTTVWEEFFLVKSKYDTCTKPPLESEVHRLLSYFFGDLLYFCCLLTNITEWLFAIIICDAITFCKRRHVSHFGLHSYVSIIWPQLIWLICLAASLFPSLPPANEVWDKVMFS